MKVFRDLKIVGAPNDLTALVTDVEANLRNGWRRDLEREKELKADSSGFGNDLTYYCFACDKRDDREAASLYLISEVPHDSVEIANIVPREIGQLSFDQYNCILENFHDTLVKPLSAKHNTTVALSDSSEDITRWVSSNTAEKLRLFSTCANKSTGSAHPADQKRWYEFLIAAHLEHSSLDPVHLERWLREEQGWDEEAASDLAIEYESAKSLLAFYDTRRGN